MAEEGTVMTIEPTETEQVETEAPEYLETDEVVDASPETDGTEEAETEEERLDPEEVEKRIQAAIAEREAEWKAEQEAQAYQYQVAQAGRQFKRATDVAIRNVVEWAAKEAESGKSTSEVLANLNAKVLEDIVEPLTSAVSTMEYEARVHLMDAYQKKVAPNWRPSPELVRHMERAVKSGNPRVAFESHFDYIRQMVIETEGPKLSEKALKEREEQAKKAGTVAAKRQETAERAAKPGPTTGVGGRGAPPADRDVIGNPKVPIAEQRRAFEKLHGFAPDF